MDNEKKIKLDELPDQGSEPEIKPVIPKPAFKSFDPRIKDIKNLSDQKRIQKLEERWHFDIMVRSWWWLLYVAGVVALEASQFLSRYTVDPEWVAEKTMGISDVVPINPGAFNFFLLHPIVLLVITPFLYRRPKPSWFYFQLSFSGIDTVRTLNVIKGVQPVRVKMKWDEITDVKRGIVKGREVLILHDVTGPVAEMIWDIPLIKKKVVNKVVMSMVSVKHPFRQFMEKEID